jgi:hypothetical protein
MARLPLAFPATRHSGELTVFYEFVLQFQATPAHVKDRQMGQKHALRP